MNQPASRTPHWFYLADSNIECGDDAKSLELYLREHGQNGVSAAVMSHESAGTLLH